MSRPSTLPPRRRRATRHGASSGSNESRARARVATTRGRSRNPKASIAISSGPVRSVIESGLAARTPNGRSVRGPFLPSGRTSRVSGARSRSRRLPAAGMVRSLPGPGVRFTNRARDLATLRAGSVQVSPSTRRHGHGGATATAASAAGDHPSRAVSPSSGSPALVPPHARRDALGGAPPDWLDSARAFRAACHARTAVRGPHAHTLLTRGDTGVR